MMWEKQIKKNETDNESITRIGNIEMAPEFICNVIQFIHSAYKNANNVVYTIILFTSLAR